MLSDPNMVLFSTFNQRHVVSQLLFPNLQAFADGCLEQVKLIFQ